MAAAERWWVGSPGCTAYTPEGVQVIITGVEHRRDVAVGAFAKAAEGDHMFYATLRPDGRWSEVVSCREISRDDFDRITGLDEIRREWGWVA